MPAFIGCECIELQRANIAFMPFAGAGRGATQAKAPSISSTFGRERRSVVCFASLSTLAESWRKLFRWLQERGGDGMDWPAWRVKLSVTASCTSARRGANSVNTGRTGTPEDESTMAKINSLASLGLAVLMSHCALPSTTKAQPPDANRDWHESPPACKANTTQVTQTDDRSALVPPQIRRRARLWTPAHERLDA